VISSVSECASLRNYLTYYRSVGGIKRDRAVVSRYALRKGLLRPKYLGKLHWQVGKKVIKDRDVVRSIQSRFGELKVSGEGWRYVKGVPEEVRSALINARAMRIRTLSLIASGYVRNIFRYWSTRYIWDAVVRCPKCGRSIPSMLGSVRTAATA